MRRFRITEPMNLQGDRFVNKRAIAEEKAQGVGGTYPKREIMAMRAKTTPATMIPILAPDVIWTLESFKRSGRVSIANGDNQDKHDQKKRRDHALCTNQKNTPAARPLARRDRREEMKTAILVGIQQQKYLRLPIVLSSRIR